MDKKMTTKLIITVILQFFIQSITTLRADSHIQPETTIGLITSGNGADFYASTVTEAIDVINRNRTASGKSRVGLVHQTVNVPDVYTLSSKVCSLASSGAMAILSKLSSEFDELLSTIPLVQQIPVIPFSTGYCAGIKDYECNNATSDAEPILASVLFSIVQFQNWEEVLIFYDEPYSKLVNWIIGNLSSHQLQISLFNIEIMNITSMLEVKSTFQNRDYFIVMATFWRTAWLLAQARITDLDILGPKYQWLIADEQHFDRNRLLNLLIEGDNVAFLAEEKHAMESQVNNTLIWLLEELDQFMLDGLRTNDIKACHRETLKMPHSLDRIRFTDKLQRSPRPWEEQIVKIYTLAPHPESQIHWDDIGSWTLSAGLEIHGFLFPDTHRGFNNRTFRITTVNYPPFMIRMENGSYGGICFELLAELQSVMNFSYEIIEPESQDFGTKLPNGSFTGMMKLIQEKKVDFAVAIFGVNAERKTVADFTTPFMADPTIILMKKPDLATSKVFICLGPFNYQVWFLIALSVIVVGIILWLLVWTHPLHNPRNIKDRKEVGIYDIKINIWQIFGALMQQGMVYIPESHSARIMIAAWWFYTIVVVGTYNGNLIAFLTAPKVHTPVNSLTELADSGMKFGFAHGTMLHGVFKDADEGVFKDLWDKISNDRDAYIVNENSHGMELALKRPSYAFLLEKSYYDTLPNKNLSFRNESCMFARAKESFLNMYYAFPFQKDSPYVKSFDKVIMGILEAGLLEKWRRKWYAAVHRCTGLERTKEQSNISLAEAQGAFYILAIGLFVATIVLFSEKIWVYTRHRFQRTSMNHMESNGVIGNGSMNGAVYHVGSLPPIVRVVNHVPSKSGKKQPKRTDLTRTEEIQLHYAPMKFSPYPVVRQGGKVKRSRSFPLVFSSCCRGGDSVSSDLDSWELAEAIGNLPKSTNSGTKTIKLQRPEQSVSLLFNYSPAIAWNGKSDRLWGSTSQSPSNGTLRRRWHSDVGSYMNGGLAKDAETGEYLKKKDKWL